MKKIGILAVMAAAVSGTSSAYVGGVVGKNEGTMRNCHGTGAVSNGDRRQAA